VCFLLKCGLNRGIVKKIATTLTATGLNFTRVILTVCISLLVKALLKFHSFHLILQAEL